jgi:alpha-galactosidase
MKSFRIVLIPILLTLLLDLSCSKNSESVSKTAMDTNMPAYRPPMGWNSYNSFGGNVKEDEVKANADFLADHLKPYGWEYVVVDFLWYCDDQDSQEKFMNRRPKQHIDGYGRLIPSELLHPSSSGGKGFKPLADYVHGKGLKFGIHIMRGIPHQAVDQNTPILNSEARAASIANLTDTCIWYGGLTGVAMTRDGAQEYYNSLFELYAAWGVDYVKIDDIAFPYHADEIEAVHKAMLKSGRPMVLSLSPGPAFIGNPKHLSENANMWRISGDFWDHWESLVKQVSLCRQWAPFTGPGHWPDADMLPLGKLNKRTELGNSPERFSNFSSDEKYFLMTLWSIFRSPLMFGGNLPETDSATLALITNKEVLRVNQYSCHNCELSFGDSLSVWGADDSEKNRSYRAFLNIGSHEKFVEPELLLKVGARLKVRDLWRHVDVDLTDAKSSLKVPAHGALLVSFENE